MALQHLRSNTASKRSTPASMADGQLAINTNATSPGLFFKDAGGALIKVGPVHVGTSAPNSSPAGSSGNAIGEQWLDTSGGGYVLKIWDGSAWRSEVGEFVDAAGDTMTGALILPSGTAAAPALGVGSTDNGLYSPGADQVAISTNGTGRLFVDSSGNVGVGVSSPGQLLHISGGNPAFQFQPALDSQNSLIIFRNAANSTTKGLIYYNHSNDSLNFTTNGTTTDAVIDSSGRLGVGNNSPGQTLDVVGDAQIGPLNGTATLYLGPRNLSSSFRYNGSTGNLEIAPRGAFGTVFNNNTAGTSEWGRWDSNGRLLVGTSSQSGGSLLQVNDDRIRIASSKTPASASVTGTAGEICWDSSYIYVCTATNTWKRAALSTW